MRTFSQNQNRFPKRKTSESARPHTATPWLHQRADLMVNLQRTIGNQAAQQMLRTHAEAFKPELAATAPLQLSKHVSRSHSRSPAAGAAQTKLPISKPGDGYEQEADEVASQVMRIPEPELPSACTCGGECPKCQANRSAQGFERPQKRRGQTDNSRQVALPPVVHDVLASPGHPLDLATRVFMEQRFGHDFGQVRIHADAKAAESAGAIDALAYAAGPDIAFGAGQYAPHTRAGRMLLAHELTHVTQDAGNVIRRRSTAQEAKAQKREAWLKELAEQPDQAHHAWKRLTSTERKSVVTHMSNRYGHDFAKSFVWYTEHPVRSVYSAFGSNDPHPTDWFQARGYQLWQKTLGATPTSMGEFWVHPSGNVILQLFDQAKGTPTTKTAEPPVQVPPGECAAMADAALSILRDTISTEVSVKQDLEGQKGRLERMDKTTDDYREQYDDYVQSLQGMKDRLEAAVDDVGTMRKQLEEMKCSVSTLDNGLQELSELQIWADFESDPRSTQFLQPLRVRLKDLPDDGS